MSSVAINACLLPSGAFSTNTDLSCSPLQPLKLLAPFICTNVVAVLPQIHLGRQERRDRYRFFDKASSTSVPPRKAHLEDLRDQYYPRLKKTNATLPALIDGSWDPCSAIICSILSVTAAIISGVMLKQGSKHQIDLSIAILLWLTRPRLFCLTIIASRDHDRLKQNHSLVETALDLFCQDCIMSTLAIPFAGMTLYKTGLEGVRAMDCVESLLGTRPSQAGFILFWGGAMGIIITAVVGGICLAMLAFRLLKTGRRDFMTKNETLMAGLLSVANFSASWVFWAGFLKLPLQDIFCLSDGYIVGLTMLNCAFPFFNAIARSWVGYPFNGPRP